jgi:hypothetical protein
MFKSGIAMTKQIIVQNGSLEQEAFWNVWNVITFMGKISVDMDDSIYSGILIIALGCASKEQNTKRLEADVLRRWRTKIFHVCVQIPSAHIFRTLCAESPVAFGVGAALQTLFSTVCSFISSHSWRIFRNATRPLLVCARCGQTSASVFVSFWKIVAFKVAFYKSWKCLRLQLAL